MHQMGSENKSANKKSMSNALSLQLELLAGVNRDIDIGKQKKSAAMVRQYEKLKREYTKELLNILAVYDLPITMTKAKPVQAEPKVTTA
jgi:hypothetical protein